MADWRWSAPTHNYRDLDTGRFVSGAQVHQWSAAASKASADAVGTMADLLAEGKLSVRDWTLLMRDEIKDIYVQQYVLAKGGLSQMTQRDWGSVGGMLREQYAYLDAFARQVADGGVAAGQIARRARMYAASSKEAFERATQRVMVESGRGEVRWRMTPAEHCPDCIAFSELGWQRIDSNPFGGAIPGSGATRCLTNCACEMDYR
jgi:hypothetical protein